MLCRKDRLNFVVVDGEAMFFRQRDGPYFPLLRTLHRCGYYDGYNMRSLVPCRRPITGHSSHCQPKLKTSTCLSGAIIAVPNMMPRIQVDTGAIKFVLGGANVMCPGINSPGGAILTELPEGAPVAVYAQGKENALAVGFLKMSTADM